MDIVTAAKLPIQIIWQTSKTNLPAQETQRLNGVDNVLNDAVGEQKKKKTLCGYNSYLL